MSDTETKKETKAERKERKRLKKLKKEAKRAKKRKLEELQNGATEEVETPAAKKMKLSDDEKEPKEEPKEETNFDEINKAIVTASKENLQHAVLKGATQSPSNVPSLLMNLQAPSIDKSVSAILYKPSPGKISGVVLKWKHDKGFGFIKRDDGKEDIFCHVREVWLDPASGHRNPKAGTHVEFDVVPGRTDPTRFQASQVSGLGGAYAEGGMEMEGTVSTWREERMFGFITGDDGNEYFAGDRDIWIPCGVLTPGERVQFDIKRKDDGRTQAVYINHLGAEYDEAAILAYQAEQEGPGGGTAGEEQYGYAEQNGAEGEEAQTGAATEAATAGQW